MTSRILIIAPNHQFPRLSGLADDAAALRRHFVDRDPLNVLTPQDHTPLRAVQTAAALPRAAASGGR